MKEKIGDTNYDELFSKARIQKSRKRANLFMVVVADSLTFKEAQRTRDLAIENGFRDDTFLRKSNTE